MVFQLGLQVPDFLLVVFRIQTFQLFADILDLFNVTLNVFLSFFQLFIKFPFGFGLNRLIRFLCLLNVCFQTRAESQASVKVINDHIARSFRAHIVF